MKSKERERDRHIYREAERQINRDSVRESLGRET